MRRRGLLQQDLLLLRSPEEHQRLRRRKLLEVLSSLWTPPVVFSVFFALYLCVLPFLGDSYRGLRLALLGLAGLCAGWFLVGFILAFIPPMSRRRSLRMRASEVLSDLDAAINRKRTISRTLIAELAEVARRLENAWADGDEGTLSRELERTGRALDAKLPKWRQSDLLGFGLGLAKAVLAVGFLRVVLLEPFSIPSGSMLPTLQIGDYVLVNKFVYGVQVPFQNKVPFVLVRRPARGDVIVFNNPLDDSVNLIKRVAGVPGDVVEIRNEVVYVNGVAQPRELIAPSYVVHERAGDRWFARDAVLYAEALSAVPHFSLQYPTHPYARERQGPYEVPEGHVFVLGDNRDGSEDSRAGFGLSSKVEFVPYGHIKGRAAAVFISFGPGGVLSSLFGGVGVRLERLFVPVL